MQILTGTDVIYQNISGIDRQSRILSYISAFLVPELLSKARKCQSMSMQKI